MRKLITQNGYETQFIAKKLAQTLKGGEIVCLFGDLGSGKTTFAQGMLEELGAEKPYTSPTFTIIKEYPVIWKKSDHSTDKFKIYHLDVYRIKTEDLLNLGWQDFAGKKNTVTIIEWAEKIKDILPKNILRINLEFINENTRTITII